MDIVKDIYHRLQDFRSRGLEPPEAIGLTKRELELIFERDGKVFDEAMLPVTIWGHPVIIVKG